MSYRLTVLLSFPLLFVGNGPAAARPSLGELQGRVTTLEADLNQETSERIAADDALQQAIAAESAQRVVADQDLQTQIDALAASIPTPPVAVRTVALSGADYTDPEAALRDAPSWCGGPGPDHRCLVRVLPGVYHVPSHVPMQAYIDLEGSGRDVTVIVGQGDRFMPAVVLGAANAELRDLTVIIESTETSAYAITNRSGADMRITRVVARAFGARDNYGIYNQNSSPEIVDVVAEAGGGAAEERINSGVRNDGGAPVLRNVRAVGEAGMENYGIQNNNSAPVLVEVSATGSGGVAAYGIFNSHSNTRVSGGEVQSFGIDFASPAVFNTGSGSVISLLNVTVKAASSNAIFNDSGATARVQGGTLEGVAGVFNAGGTLEIHHARVKGSSSTGISSHGAGYLGSSQVVGGVSGGGPLFCFGLYDDLFNPITCP